MSQLCNCGCGQPRDRVRAFWVKVDKTPGLGKGNCWLFTGCLDQNGYGKFRYPGEQLAHRAAYRIRHGRIPTGKDVLHTCDVPNCVRHIYAGTHQQNMRDRDQRGRTSRGPTHGRACRRVA